MSKDFRGAKKTSVALKNSCIHQIMQNMTAYIKRNISHRNTSCTWVARVSTCCTSSWVSVGFLRNSFTMAVSSCSCTCHQHTHFLLQILIYCFNT